MMTRVLCQCGFVFALLAGVGIAPSQVKEGGEIRLPDGRSQRDAILKAEYEQTLKDVTQLIELAEQLKQELEKNEHHVLSIASLKKTDEIEKLAKRIRSRLRR
jgi:hypothetical protein